MSDKAESTYSGKVKIEQHDTQQPSCTYVLIEAKDKEGVELFQPSNSSHGAWFMARFCDRCVKFPHDQDAKNQCMIFLSTMAVDVDDPDYPREWRYVDGEPVCTAFKSRDEYNAERRARRKGVLATDKNTFDLFGGGL